MIINENIRNFLKNASEAPKKKEGLVYSVYAICKNELKNVDDWLKQFGDHCDYICVLDTGSKDGTYERLLEHAKTDKRIIVKQKIYEQFHYDEARNDSYDLMPPCTDVCVTVDFDERLQPDWYESLNKQYGNLVLERLIHIRRDVYEKGKPNGRTDTRLVYHPYLKDNKVFKWYGYSGENIVYGYDEDIPLEEIDKKFRMYNSLYTNSLYCNHYLEPYSFKTILKNVDGKQKCVNFFYDTHLKFLKETKFIKLITYFHSRLIDYHSFICIFSEYSNQSDECIEQDLIHMEAVITNQKIDVSNLQVDLLSFIIDGILKQKGIIFRKHVQDRVDKIINLLIEYSSNKERTKSFIRGIQAELDSKFTEETTRWKIEETKKRENCK